MADLINIRPTRDNATSEKMDAAAKALGMSRNEMILKAIDIINGDIVNNGWHIYLKDICTYAAFSKAS